jgi:N-acyl homoserine lactone hydrolase
MKLDILFHGFPGKSNRGFLGWSSCVLLRGKNNKPILFDTAGFNERYSLLSKLDGLGIRPHDIETVFLSHFHFDHAVNYSLFENACFYLHEKEVEHVKQNGKKDLAIPFEMFAALENSGKLAVLSGDQGETEGIMWRHTPGHTPGLYSLFLEHEGERWVLASDAVKNRYELLAEEAAMTWNDEESSQSIRMIKEWADVVLPGHDQLLRVIRNGEKTEVKALGKCDINIILPQNSNGGEKIISLEF